jgi:predicted HNH restriction endonuclease
MKLYEVIRRETGVHPEKIMLLRHSNGRVILLLEHGAQLLEEYTLVQPINSKYDFLAEKKLPIEIVAVIVYDKVHAIYRIQGVEKLGTTYSLVSPAHRELTIKWGYIELPAKAFKAIKMQSCSIGLPVSGWTSPRRAVARYGDKLFESTQININIFNSQEFPDELPTGATHIEGAQKTIVVNQYERDSAAREKCKSQWGVNCNVCGFDFQKVYGERGVGFIHVHHLVPISTIKKEYQLDPIKDLRPVCPNCHSIIHRYDPAISIEELKELLQNRSPESAQ